MTCSSTMRVLFNVRGDYLSNPGGDTVQIAETAKALTAMGIRVGISASPRPGTESWDAVHVFNTTRPKLSLDQCLNARERGTPVALSTIYWNLDEFLCHGLSKSLNRIYHRTFRSGAGGTRLEALIRSVFGRSRGSGGSTCPVSGYRNMQIGMMELADILLPNSETEMDLIRRDLNPRTPHLVVPNAASAEFGNGRSDMFLDRFGHPGLSRRGFLLCVARIEERKNTLRLVRAIRRTSIPLAVIGAPSAGGKRYYNLCRAAANERIHFLGPIGRDELPHAFAAARAHILPSWFETPGLASLEAALAGCAIATTDRGSARDYFGDAAHYCDPSSVDSIAEAAQLAFDTPPPGPLREMVSECFTWEEAARRTSQAYERIVSQ